MWGLFILSILLFCTTGMISAGRMHLYLPLLHHRDYFAPAGFIPTLLFFTTGITLPRLDSSLSCSFAPQGWFPPVGCISILLFCSTKIISAGRMHLYLALFFHRDDFAPVRCVPTSEKTRNLCFFICLTPRRMRYGSKASYAYPRHSPHTAHRIMVPLWASSHSTLCSVCAWLIANAWHQDYRLNMARVDSKNVKVHSSVCENISTAILAHLTVLGNISIGILPCFCNLVVCGNISMNYLSTIF